jgi:hypothetical protein
VTIDRYGHLFRSDAHARTMHAIADTINNPAAAPAGDERAPEMVGFHAKIEPWVRFQ